MAQALAVKPTTELTEAQSLAITRNLLRIAIFNISYIRGLFPEKHFKDMYIGDIEMKVKKLLPLDMESRRLIDWMEKGVYDALQKKYLKSLLFGLCSGEDGPLVEEYEFSFAYPKDSPEVQMSVVCSDGTKKGKQKKLQSEIPELRKAICRMVRTLIELMRTLGNLPTERTILMKLVYYDETPEDYEPPFFRACTEEDKKTWLKPPLKMKVGDVTSKHYTVALKVKSLLDPCVEDNQNEGGTQRMLDPCEDENEEACSPSDAETEDAGDVNAKDDANAMEVDQQQQEVDRQQQDGSTIGGVHTTGSDVTRHAAETTSKLAAADSNGGMHSTAARWSQKPAMSRESTARNNAPRDWNQGSQSVEGSRQLKASMVEKAIYQAAKRLRGN